MSPPTPPLLPPPRQGFIDRLTSAHRAKRSVLYYSCFRALFLFRTVKRIYYQNIISYETRTAMLTLPNIT